MEPYYYVINKLGYAPQHKHPTRESAVAEAERLCKKQPTHVFEVVQCLAIVSASRPQVTTFYMDGVNPNKDSRYEGFPDRFLNRCPLPEIPEGYTKAIYRGNRWFAENVKYATYSESDDVAWCYEKYNRAYGAPDLHYCEFVK
jgi:hypothetical protein